MYHGVGAGPAQNAFICIKWVLLWLFAGGIPCVIAMYFPAWPEVPPHNVKH
jgi:hypothetical protein